MRHIISELCDISDKSYYVWKNKSHSRLISLIEKYFSKDDLREFLETGKISKLEPTNIQDLEQRIVQLEQRIISLEKMKEATCTNYEQEIKEADILINKLQRYYNVGTLQALGEKIGVAQTTISGWSTRNSVKAISRKIYELKLPIEI